MDVDVLNGDRDSKFRTRIMTGLKMLEDGRCELKKQEEVV
jgi:hypothetical protein